MTTPNLIVEFRLLHPDAVRPEYQTDGASGMDLCFLGMRQARADGTATEPRNLEIPRDWRAVCNTGIAVSIPQGWEAQIRPRSSLSARGILCQLGTIDSDYRGELKVVLVNLSGEPFEVRRGDRIAQLVFAPVGHAQLQLVKEFSTQTKRGESGFGSTRRRDGKPYIRPEDGLVGLDSHGPNCSCPLHADYT